MKLCRRWESLLGVWLLLACGDGDARDARRPAPPQIADDAASDAEVDAAPEPDASAPRRDARGGQASEGGRLDGGAGSGPMREVELRFAAKVFDDAFACGASYAGVGRTKVAITPVDLRFFVQDVRLLDDAGREVAVKLKDRAPWQVPGVGLLDFADRSGSCGKGSAETNDVLVGEVPEGTYRGLVFTNGVPEARNHADPLRHPPPLQATDLTWGWLTGFKFIVAEVEATGARGSADDDAGTLAPSGSALLHVGSTACSVNGPATLCRNSNRNSIRLSDFDPDSSVVVFDVGELFAATDLARETQCHSDKPEECEELFARVGVDWDSGARLDPQRVFRVE